jgi:putative hydrolase of the HAD superfamily
MNQPMIIFDVGGTLLHFDRAKLAQFYARAVSERNILLDFTRIEIVLEGLEHELPSLSQERELSLEEDMGKSFWDFFYAEGFRRLGIKADMSEPVAEIRARFMRGEFEALFDDTVPTLEAFASRGVPMGIVSNFSPNLEQILRQQGIHRYFDFFIVSAIAGVEKPDPRIFDLAVDVGKYAREQLVYVGDSIFHDMQGAQNAHIAGILVDRTNRFPDYPGERIENLMELVEIIGEGHAVKTRA